MTSRLGGWMGGWMVFEEEGRGARVAEACASVGGEYSSRSSAATTHPTHTAAAAAASPVSPTWIAFICPDAPAAARSSAQTSGVRKLSIVKTGGSMFWTRSPGWARSTGRKAWASICENPGGQGWGGVGGRFVGVSVEEGGREGGRGQGR
jgi:hypothetical protein